MSPCGSGYPGIPSSPTSASSAGLHQQFQLLVTETALNSRCSCQTFTEDVHLLQSLAPSSIFPAGPGPNLFGAEPEVAGHHSAVLETTGQVVNNVLIVQTVVLI